MLKVENRYLNEISLYMKAKGFDIIAKRTIDPIIAKTAKMGKKMAEIYDPEIISNVEYLIKKLKEDAEYRMNRYAIVKT